MRDGRTSASVNFNTVALTADEQESVMTFLYYSDNTPETKTPISIGANETFEEASVKIDNVERCEHNTTTVYLSNGFYFILNADEVKHIATPDHVEKCGGE